MTSTSFAIVAQLLVLSSTSTSVAATQKKVSDWTLGLTDEAGKVHPARFYGDGNSFSFETAVSAWSADTSECRLWYLPTTDMKRIFASENGKLAVASAAEKPSLGAGLTWTFEQIDEATCGGDLSPAFSPDKVLRVWLPSDPVAVADGNAAKVYLTANATNGTFVSKDEWCTDASVRKTLVTSIPDTEMMKQAVTGSKAAECVQTQMAPMFLPQAIAASNATTTAVAGSEATGHTLASAKVMLAAGLRVAARSIASDSASTSAAAVTVNENKSILLPLESAALRVLVSEKAVEVSRKALVSGFSANGQAATKALLQSAAVVLANEQAAGAKVHGDAAITGPASGEPVPQQGTGGADKVETPTEATSVEEIVKRVFSDVETRTVLLCLLLLLLICGVAVWRIRRSCLARRCQGVENDETELPRFANPECSSAENSPTPRASQWSFRSGVRQGRRQEIEVGSGRQSVHPGAVRSARLPKPSLGLPRSQESVNVSVPFTFPAAPFSEAWKDVAVPKFFQM